MALGIIYKKLSHWVRFYRIYGEGRSINCVVLDRNMIIQENRRKNVGDVWKQISKKDT